MQVSFSWPVVLGRRKLMYTTDRIEDIISELEKKKIVLLKDNGNSIFKTLEENSTYEQLCTLDHNCKSVRFHLFPLHYKKSTIISKKEIHNKTAAIKKLYEIAGEENKSNPFVDQGFLKTLKESGFMQSEYLLIREEERRKIR